MSYFLFPKANNKTYQNLDCIFDSTPAAAAENNISNSLNQYLFNIKTLIDNYQQWDNIKKFTNPYEYIHTVVPSSKYSVCKYKPISRSYFKMIEIINTFQLLQPYKATPTPPDHQFSTFHLAEGPGGFIEAIVNLRRNTNDVYVGMTLIDDANENVPGWKKSRDFLLRTPNIFLEKGEDGDGNILSYNNLRHCYKKYNSSMDFITGDGGFDFTVNFNDQESMMIRLIFAQMCYALLLQRRGGTFVLKVFDCFMGATVDIIYILCSFYEKVSIIKPQTSRHANSERYIVCTGFQYYSNHLFRDHVFSSFEKMATTENIPTRFLRDYNIPYIFLKRIEECNAVIGQNQLECINNTINLIENKYKNEKIDFLKKTNISKCISWCVQNGMPYHSQFCSEYSYSL
jgi:23S rRNA U2552 (ribose-2'-O)-methylase RlmE/FtsJ